MSQTENLHTTPLHKMHQAHQASMTAFAGYHMPVQYATGVKAEHLHTRQKASLFDVSHMGQIWLTGDNAASALETLVPVDIADLPIGKQRYALFTNEQGGILDDLMVSRLKDGLLLVVNAACKDQDINHLQNYLPKSLSLKILDRALLALQGPKAGAILKALLPETEKMVFMDAQALCWQNIELIVARSGYTGEDGFEISVPSEHAEQLAEALLVHSDVQWAGLGARDSLRLEAGLCLYGQDMDANTTPIEADLMWAISKIRRADGVRAGGFLGAEIILQQIANRNNTHKRVGLKIHARAPLRAGVPILNHQDKVIGEVSSGCFSPTLNEPIAMARIERAYATIDTPLFALLRGKKIPVTVIKMPFVQQRYYRGIK